MPAALLLLGALAALVPAIGADDLRLTTPRGDLVREADGLYLAVPGGRAWGITSGLLLLEQGHLRADGRGSSAVVERGRAGATSIAAEIEVRDPRVAHAFLRVAWYDRATGRPRQIAIQDSQLVRHGERARVAVRLLPPAGAVAYRIRVLARLIETASRSAPAGIVVRGLRVEGAGRERPRPTRLLIGTREDRQALR